MSNKINLYDEFGLTRNADRSAIDNALPQPGAVANDPVAAEKTAVARAILLDDTKRATYDAALDDESTEITVGYLRDLAGPPASAGQSPMPPHMQPPQMPPHMQPPQMPPHMQPPPVQQPPQMQPPQMQPPVTPQDPPASPEQQWTAGKAKPMTYILAGAAGFVAGLIVVALVGTFFAFTGNDGRGDKGPRSFAQEFLDISKPAEARDWLTENADKQYKDSDSYRDLKESFGDKYDDVSDYFHTEKPKAALSINLDFVALAMGLQGGGGIDKDSMSRFEEDIRSELDKTDDLAVALFNVMQRARPSDVLEGCDHMYAVGIANEDLDRDRGGMLVCESGKGYKVLSIDNS